MKLGKNETATRRPTIRLDAHEGYRHAAAKLEELKKQIAPHKNEAVRIEMQLTRASAAARQYITRGVRLFRYFDTAEWDAVLRKVITQGMVDERLLREVCAETPKPQVPEDDLKTIRALDDEQVLIELLKGAIELQEKEVRMQKKVAIAHICESLRVDRQPIIRKLAEALTQLGQAVAEEQAFDAYLADIEPDLAAGIKPRIFPTLLANADLFHWFGECINTDLLTDEQIRSLEQVIPLQQAAVGA